MSGSANSDLKLRLQQLTCHFTRTPLLETINPDELADKLYDQVKFLDTKNKYMVYNLLAYVMHLKADYTQAIANLEQAEKNIKENNPTGQKYLVTYGNYAWVFNCLNEYEKSQKYIEKVEQIYKELKDNPDIAEIHGEKAWSLLHFGGRYYEEAKQCFLKALELEPGDPEWNSGYATVVYRLEDFDGRNCPASECKSLELLERAVEKNPNDAVVKSLLALKLQDLDRTDEGKIYIEKAINHAPSYPYLLRYVAKFYRRAGMVDDALRVLQTAVDAMPTSAFLHHQIGQCYRYKYFDKKRFGNRNTEELNDLLQNTLFHFEKALKYKKAFVYLDLAKMYCVAKEYEKAEDTFKTVMAFTLLTEDEKQQIYSNYGRFKEQNMRSESEAINYYKKCLQITLCTEHRDSAEKSLKRIAERKIQYRIPDAEGFALLGFVHKTNGEITFAIDFYEKALRYDPYNAEYVSELRELRLAI